MQIQSGMQYAIYVSVVICFKFSNFAYANTVLICSMAVVKLLLFALNLVTLLMQIQSVAVQRHTQISCYLL